MIPLRHYPSLIVVVSLIGASLCAAEPAPAADSASINVWAIRATTKNKEISPELKSIAGKLKKQFKYTGFKLERKSSGSADLGKSFTATLIAGYSAKVTPKKRDGKRMQMQVEVYKEKARKINVTVTVNAGQYQLLGGWKLSSTDALIVAVSAK